MHEDAFREELPDYAALPEFPMTNPLNLRPAFIFPGDAIGIGLCSRSAIHFRYLCRELPVAGFQLSAPGVTMTRSVGNAWIPRCARNDTQSVSMQH